jgi:hypothetical protein
VGEPHHARARTLALQESAHRWFRLRGGGPGDDLGRAAGPGAAPPCCAAVDRGPIHTRARVGPFPGAAAVEVSRRRGRRGEIPRGDRNADDLHDILAARPARRRQFGVARPALSVGGSSAAAVCQGDFRKSGCRNRQSRHGLVNGAAGPWSHGERLAGVTAGRGAGRGGSGRGGGAGSQAAEQRLSTAGDGLPPVVGPKSSGASLAHSSTFRSTR